MSARKLSRIAGLVFMVAALVGGAAATGSVQQTATERVAAPVQAQLIDVDWT